MRGCCLPLGSGEVSPKTLSVTSGPLRTLNHALSWPASAQQQPRLLPQLEMQYATYPGRETTQEAHRVSHTHAGKTKVLVLVQWYTHTQACNQAHVERHTHTHMQASVFCPGDASWMVCGDRSEGAEEFHNKWWFQWFLSLGCENHKNSRLPLRRISKSLCSKGAEDMSDF